MIGPAEIEDMLDDLAERLGTDEVKASWPVLAAAVEKPLSPEPTAMVVEAD